MCVCGFLFSRALKENNVIRAPRCMTELARGFASSACASARLAEQQRFAAQWLAIVPAFNQSAAADFGGGDWTERARRWQDGDSADARVRPFGKRTPPHRRL